MHEIWIINNILLDERTDFSDIDAYQQCDNKQA